MSASAASHPRVARNHSELVATLECLNTLCENQRVLTAAELRLALILIRRGAHREPVKVSARNWQAWTGLDPKSRELAIRGLKNKGFEIEGRGDAAQFRFVPSSWMGYVRTTRQEEKPHVEQKRVPAKPSQMIHPECREQGCYLARKQESDVIQIDSVPQEAQWQTKNLKTTTSKTTTKTTPNFATTTQKTTTNSTTSTTTNSETMTNSTKTTRKIEFPRAYAEMTARCATVGPEFLDRLLERLPANITDQELEHAIRIGTKPGQRTEGLWLRTIPVVIQNTRDRARQQNDATMREYQKLRTEAVATGDHDGVELIDAAIARLTAGSS